MVTFGNAFIQQPQTWTTLLQTVMTNSLSFNYDTDGTSYLIYAVDDPVVYFTTIWRSTVPSSITGIYSQNQNDTDKAVWEGGYISSSNIKLDNPTTYTDPRLLHRFGNITTTATSEVLVSSRPYTEQASQAQRSVVSTSANDVNPGGSGAKQVRITYLDSNYNLKTEDVLLNGTTPVNTVGTDIRFVERMEVIKGSDAAGAVKLMTGTGGGGVEICGIASATGETFLCHHYVPVSKSAVVYGWGGTADTNVALKLKTQMWFNGNIVDEVTDLDKLYGVTTPSNGKVTFYRQLYGIKIPSRTYIRVNVVPSASISTITRTYLDLLDVWG